MCAVIDRESMKVSPSLSTFTLCVNSRLVSLNCSIGPSNPLPLLTWSRLVEGGYERLSDGHLQAPTGYNETAYSILTVDLWKLGAGTHEFVCDAHVQHWHTALAPWHVKATINVLPPPEWVLSRCPDEGKSIGHQELGS